MNTNQNQPFIEKVRLFGIDLWAFIKTKNFLINAGIAASISIVLFIFTLIIMNVYTDHGESISVPDFTGLSLIEIERTADQAGVRFEIIDSVYNATGKKGGVVEQNPPPGFKVKENRTIFLTIKTLDVEQVPLPDMVGVSLIQAKSDMETYGLKIGKITYRPDVATNSVLEQQYRGKIIRKGALVPKGASIDLVLGQGEGTRSSTVPELAGLSLDEAKSEIKRAFLALGNITYDESVISQQDSIDAFVWKQSPNSFSALLVGEPVDIWLTVSATQDNEL